VRIGEVCIVRGCVTKEKFIRGRALADLEKLLGFSAGRLRQGIGVIRPCRLPAATEFDLGGYTQVAIHRHETPRGVVPAVLRQNAHDSWTLRGPESLVKIVAFTPHNPELSDDFQYPPGGGIPQWVVKPLARVPGVVVALVTGYPGGRWP
jgi:hypothetical protein